MGSNPGSDPPLSDVPREEVPVVADVISTHLIRDPAQMLKFAAAGRAYFTVRNTATGNRVTYCVESDESGGSTVRVFTGTENTNRKHYSYLGSIREDGSYHHAGPLAAADALIVAAEEGEDKWLSGFAKSVRAILGRGGALTDRQKTVLAKNVKTSGVIASPLEPTDMRARAFEWLWRMLKSAKPLPPTFEFWHEGRCGKCGKKLTTPESIERGLGPECAKNG